MLFFLAMERKSRDWVLNTCESVGCPAVFLWPHLMGAREFLSIDYDREIEAWISTLRRG